MVDTSVSNADAAKCAGSSPVGGSGFLSLLPRIHSNESPSEHRCEDEKKRRGEQVVKKR